MGGTVILVPSNKKVRGPGPPAPPPVPTPMQILPSLPVNAKYYRERNYWSKLVEVQVIFKANIKFKTRPLVNSECLIYFFFRHKIL